MNDVRADTAQYSCEVGGQRFRVLAMSCHEGMSSLFRIHLSLWSDEPEVPIASLIRQDAQVRISWGSLEKKYFGIVASFSQTDAGRPGIGGVDRVWGQYQAVVVPTLWLLGHKSNCRIFQNMTADEIIKKVLDERGMMGKYDPRMGSYPVREYCVQYRESDLAFISRLMEDEGIFYYFTHDGSEKMVLGDATAHYGDCAPQESVEYRTPSGVLSTSAEYLSSLSYEENAYSGKMKTKDFDYRNPTQPLRVEHSGPANPDLELYDYRVEHYADDGRGRALARIAIEAQSARRKTIAAGGTWRSASSGCKFTLSRAYRSDLNGSWVVISVDHHATQDASGGVQNSTSLVAIPAETPFRPWPATPIPMVNPQTATVVGPPGDRIYMDRFGRAKVQFRWDLEGQSNDDSSCWIRVATPYAGMEESNHKKHGMQFHPLVGDEVVVDFLDGDPDNPIIVGSVYNADNSPIVQPSELIRNRILTPYQHQLLLDDKGAAITLNTGGNEHLVMTDKNESDGKVSLATRGNQLVQLEDNSDEAGNVILLATSDGHKIQLSEKDQAQGIMAKTKNRNHINLDDGKREIKICTQDANLVLLQDDQRLIEVKTTDGRTLRLDDEHQKIELISGNVHFLELNDAGDRITLATGDSSLKLEFDLPNKTITLHAVGGDIHLVADNRLTLHGGSVDILADSQLSLRADTLEVTSNGDASIEAGGNVSVHATGNLDLEADVNVSVSGNVEASLEGQVKASVSGALVDVSGDGIVTIKGALVKIN